MHPQEDAPTPAALCAGSSPPITPQLGPSISCYTNHSRDNSNSNSNRKNNISYSTASSGSTSNTNHRSRGSSPIHTTAAMANGTPLLPACLFFALCVIFALGARLHLEHTLRVSMEMQLEILRCAHHTTPHAACAAQHTASHNTTPHDTTQLNTTHNSRQRPTLARTHHQRDPR